MSEQPKTWPAYMELYESGELARRVEEAVASLASCQVCPRNCKIDRLADETKVCHTGRLSRVSSYFAHFGEEDCLRGGNGSGTIFFAFCNLKCVFCFHPDTLIATSRGQRRIAELFDSCDERLEHAEGRIGLAQDAQVWTREGRQARVAKVFRHDFAGELISLKPMSCPPLLLTPNHQVFASSRSAPDEIRQIPAEDLTKDHYLVVPKRRLGGKSVVLDVAEILRATPTERRARRGRRVAPAQLVSALSSSRTSEAIGRELGYNPAYVRTLRSRLDHGTLLIERDQDIEVRVEDGRARFAGEWRPGIPAELVLDTSLAWLLGLYCAEGHVTKQKGRPNSHRLVFSFGRHEHGLAEKALEQLEHVLGLQPRMVSRRTTYTTEVGKASAALLFKALCGTGAANKRVPPHLLRSTEEVVRAFLEGYLRGDGGETQTHRIATTVSRPLAQGLFELGLHLNVLPSFHESQRPPTTTIEGRRVDQSTLYFVKFKKNRLAGTADPKRERSKWKDLGERFLVPVHKIERSPYEGPVYNLEVDDPDHSYLAPFLAVANCQNHDTSQAGIGQEVTKEELAAMMLDLQRQGCHNINFVTPEHVVPQMLEALLVAIEGGLRLPIVYNTSGYDSLESLRWLDGVVDIYMPDFKVWEKRSAIRYLKAKDYRPVTCEVVAEMHRQVGALQVDEQGLARRGVLVRHLVMPGLLEETGQIFRWLAELSPETYVNVMGQYRPDHEADQYAEINRRPSGREMLEARRLFQEAGLSRMDTRSPLGRLPLFRSP